MKARPNTMNHIALICSMVLIGLFMAACSTSPESIQVSSEYEEAIVEAEAMTGFTFGRESVQERDLDRGEARAFRSADGHGLLTVIIDERLTDTPYTWALSYWDGADEVVIYRSGEEKRTVSDRSAPLQTMDQCQYCAEWEVHEAEWVPAKWGWVEKFLSASSAAACASRGGSWAAGACVVMVEAIIADGYWIDEWKVCLDWDYFPEDRCLTDLRTGPSRYEVAP